MVATTLVAQMAVMVISVVMLVPINTKDFAGDFWGTQATYAHTPAWVRIINDVTILCA